MTNFNMIDTKRADGFYVTFERRIRYDCDAHPNDYLFQDPDYREQDQERLEAYHNGDWSMIGVQAVAHCMLVRNRVGTCYTLTSPGLWAIESDIGEDYLDTVFQGEIATLKADIAAMNAPIYLPAKEDQ